MNHLKHGKRLKITAKNKTSPFYSPPHRFTSYSTQDSAQNKRYQLSPHGKIFDEIIEMKPFSFINKQVGIDDKLNEIVTIHKERIDRNSFSTETIEIRSPSSQPRNLKQKCLEIIKKKQTYNKINRHRVALEGRKIEPKSTLESYDDIENEIATQLINQCKKQRKMFQSTMTRLNRQIFQAEIQYIRKNQIEVNLGHVKRFGLKSINKSGRVCTQYIEEANEFKDQNKMAKHKTILDKRDFHTWLRSSNKLINMVKIDQDTINSFHKCKVNKNIKKNVNDFLYKKYFKKHIDRKDILSSALDIAN